MKILSSTETELKKRVVYKRACNQSYTEGHWSSFRYNGDLKGGGILLHKREGISSSHLYGKIAFFRAAVKLIFNVCHLMMS